MHQQAGPDPPIQHSVDICNDRLHFGNLHISLFLCQRNARNNQGKAVHFFISITRGFVLKHISTKCIFLQRNDCFTEY